VHFCGQEPETIAHLLIGCVFARQLWFALLCPLQLDSLMPEHDEDMASWRAWVVTTDRPLFDSMLLLVAWSLWKERNGRVFGRPASSVHAVLHSLLREGEDWALAGFLPLVALSEHWSQHFVNM
jgi:hypothetical protein